MGVPTITLVSKKTAFGRAGWSQSCNLDLKELAAETPEQYVALAARLAGDLPRLQELRSSCDSGCSSRRSWTELASHDMWKKPIARCGVGGASSQSG